MPRTFNLTQLCAALLLLTSTPASWAEKLTAEESGYVGEYKRGSVDTLSQLVVLDDKTFCYAFAGGSLDLLVGGRWKVSENGGIELLQVRADKALFPAALRQEANVSKTLVFDFHGYSLGEANGPVFAVSATDAPPSTFRPLFPAEGENSWSESYKLPPMATENARYFFIGGVEDERRDGQRPSGESARIKVTQYLVENASIIRVGFDKTQAMPIMNLHAVLKGETLLVDGQTFGRPQAIRPGVVEAVHEQCIDPVLDPDKAKSAGGKKRGAEMKLLKPVKTFYIDMKAVKGAPYFDKKD